MGRIEQYIKAVAKEAEYRKRGLVLDLASFQALRRDNSAVATVMTLIGYALDIDLSDEVFEHPTSVDMYVAAVDMVTFSNVRPIGHLSAY